MDRNLKILTKLNITTYKNTIFEQNKSTHRIILSKRNIVAGTSNTGLISQHECIEKSLKKKKKLIQKPGPGPIFHILRIHTKIDEKWMQMILREVGGIIERAHIKLFRTSQYSPLKNLICKKAQLLWMPTPYMEPQAAFIWSQCQGDFCVFEGNSVKLLMHICPSYILLIIRR